MLSNYCLKRPPYQISPRREPDQWSSIFNPAGLNAEFVMLYLIKKKQTTKPKTKKVPKNQTKIETTGIALLP